MALVDPDVLKKLIKGTCPNNITKKQIIQKPRKTKAVKRRKKGSGHPKLKAGLTSSKVRASRLGKKRAASATAISFIPPLDIRRANDLEEELETVLTRKKAKNMEKNRALYNNRLSELMDIRRKRMYHVPAIPSPKPQQPQLEVADESKVDDVRRQLTFDSDDEDGIIWNDTALPRSVKVRAATLLNKLRRNKQIKWDSDTHEMIVDGQSVPGSNIIDLAAHAVSQRQANRPVRGSPGPPPGFDEFAKVLREANVPRVLLKNRRRWSEIFGKTHPSPFRDWESS